MNSTYFFQSLKDRLNENDQKILIESAKQDKLLLSYIRNNDVFTQCVETFGNSLEKWSLGKIAMFSVEAKTDVLGKDVKDKHYLKKAISLLDETFKNQSKEIDFQRSAYIALALYERKRKNQSWTGLLEELSNGFVRKSIVLKWRTSLAILFSLLNDDENFLQALIGGSDIYLGVSFVNHIFASQLIPNKEKAIKLIRFFETQSLETQIIWLQTLPVQTPFLSDQISSMLSGSKIFAAVGNKHHQDQEIDFISEFDPEFKLNLLNGFRYQLEKSPLQAKANFANAKEKLQNIFRLIDLNLIKEDYDEVQSDLKKYMNEPKFNDLAFDHLKGSNISSSVLNPEFPSNGILANLTHAYEILKGGEPLKAREMGERQFKNWLNQQAVNWPSSEIVSYLNNIDHKRIIQLLNLLGLNGLSAEYIKFLSEISFSMNDMQDELISGLQTLDLIDDAYSELKMSLSRTQDQEEVYKKIFDLLAKSKNWNALFTEWEDYSTSFAMSQEDWINYAKAALNANHLDKTKLLLEKMKSAGVNRTQIDVISGNLYYKEGDFEKARVLLEDTTKRLPDYEEGWIVLSNVYNDMGLNQKSMETLRVAVLAIPDSSVIHFNLAKNCLDQELFAEALPYIRKAVALEPNNPFYNFNLIQTLQTLGRTDEADQILSQSRLKWPHDREIAYIDAVRQIEKQNRDAALSAFDVALKSQNADISMQRLILYVQTLLGDRPEKFLPTDGKYNEISNLLNAQKILQNATNSNSEDSYYLQMLLGEVYYLTGESEAANSLYSKLVNEFKSNQQQQSLLWRIYAGLGLVKTDLLEVENGIAALQEADQLNSTHLGIKQKIAETYFSASLLNQAESKAEEIYQLGSTNIDNLLWYANFMTKTGNPDGETRGLEQILHFEPAHSTAIARLANIYISNGDVERAKNVLEKLNEANHLNNQDIRNAVVSYLRIGNYPEALDWFNKLVDDTNGAEVKKSVVEKIFLLMANQKWEIALSEIQKLKKTTINSRFVSSLEGECLFNSGDYSAAIYAFDAAFSFSANNENFLEEFLFENSLIPENWVKQKISDFLILYFLTKAHKNKFEFDQCLGMIDRMIRINPNEPWLPLMGAEFSMQLTDYELASNYILKFKTNTNNENSSKEIDLFATAVDYACAFLDGRDYRFSFKEDESNSDLGIILKAHQHLDKNLFEDALRLLEEIKTDLVEPFTLSNEDQYSEIKNSIFHRLYLILVWRLNDFPKVAALIEQFDVENTKNIEKAYLSLAIEFTYMTMLDLFKKNEVQAHRSRIFENQIGDPNKINQLLSVINHLGKTKAIKNLESFAKVFIEKDYSIGFSLINSRTLPKYMNYVLVDLLGKAGKSEIISDYISNFKSEFYENMFFLVNDQQMSLEEQIAFIEAQVPTDDPIWLIESSRIFEKSGNLQQAIELAEQAYKIWPEEEKWAIRIAKLFHEVGDFENAEQYWKNIVCHSKDPNSVIYQYTNLLTENKKAAEAIQLLNEYQGKLTESFDFYRAQAKANLVLKSYENSINAIQSARKYKPVSIELDYLEAEAYYLNAEPDKSKMKIQEILNISPTYEPAYILNSVILKENGKYSEALKIINVGLEKCPDSKGLMIEKILNLKEMGDSSNSLLLCSELSQRYPNDVEVLRILATLYYDIEDYQAAEVVARKSLHLLSNQPETHLLLGKVSRNQGQLDQALSHFSKAAMLNAESIEPWLEIGDIYQDQQESEKALEAFREAYSRDDGDFRAFYKTGLLLRDLKDYQGAEKMLRLASSLSVKDTNIRRQLAGVIALNLIHSS